MKLTVVPATDKEAVVAILGPGDFLGKLRASPSAVHELRPRLHPLPCSSLRKKRCVVKDGI